ncbi:hypothetical protein CERSUDRAFT_85967 [Gelatoporia subvermispora B]|uniref:Uncharacterized protein n=1 Tax=Ceriporiopsis subvermispora (strain B) TaxID=914234 RepID=M2R807_CERS8|nr:hypothetical protein CERSUDRAFT_85967 [Gelatoporia subvermispora B]
MTSARPLTPGGARGRNQNERMENIYETMGDARGARSRPRERSTAWDAGEDERASDAKRYVMGGCGGNKGGRICV